MSAQFIKQHHGAVVATILETEDVAVEVMQRNGGVYDLIVHNRHGESDKWDAVTAPLMPSHFETLGSIAHIMRDGKTEIMADTLEAFIRGHINMETNVNSQFNAGWWSCSMNIIAAIRNRPEFASMRCETREALAERHSKTNAQPITSRKPQDGFQAPP